MLQPHFKSSILKRQVGSGARLREGKLQGEHSPYKVLSKTNIHLELRDYVLGDSIFASSHGLGQHQNPLSGVTACYCQLPG